MIIEISVENYLSIRERITLSLEAGPSRKKIENLIKLDNSYYLKSAAIFGPNASGKSNIIKSIFFIWKMVSSSHKFNVDSTIPVIPFKLDNNVSKPSSFELIFIYKNIKYKYGFSCTKKEIINEYLYYWPKGRESLIFKRNKSKYTVNKEEESKQRPYQKQTIANTLYLSRATQLGYEKTKNAYEFIVNNIVVNIHPNWRNQTIISMYDNPKFKNKILEIMKAVDFGGITDFHMEKHEKKAVGYEINFKKDEPLVSSLPPKDFIELKFLHNDIEFNFEEESEGTRNALILLGPIFNIIEGEKVLFIDELDRSLHSNITKFLIKLFHSKNNKKAQILFTTHDTNLLDNDIFRRDQLYLCTKKPNQNTQLSSFLDYDLRENSDFENYYLNGRVGGLPFIDDTVLD
ncbi:AAA family ATPase [Candidatus Woesearchaeota archaeon]|nr:AAA family ATPase [Candidatus Woesearchaeota archaeon]